jgi:hypothetical protein
VLEIGTTTAYGRSTEIPIPAGQAEGYDVYEDWDSLAPGTTYHWRMRYLRTGKSPVIGADRSFATPGATTGGTTASTGATSTSASTGAASTGSTGTPGGTTATAGTTATTGTTATSATTGTTATSATTGTTGTTGGTTSTAGTSTTATTGTTTGTTSTTGGTTGTTGPPLPPPPRLAAAMSASAPKSVRLASLLTGGVKVTIANLAPGVADAVALTVTPPKSRTLPRPKPVVVGRAVRRNAPKGKVVVVVRLSAKGKALLRKLKQTTVTATVDATGPKLSPMTFTLSIRVRRR